MHVLFCCPNKHKWTNFYVLLSTDSIPCILSSLSLSNLFLRRIYVYMVYTVYTWAFCWQEVPVFWKAGLAQLSSAASPLCILSLIHTAIFYWYAHTRMQGHVRRDCVCVIYVYTWESLWQGVSRMCVYMCVVDCTHSPKHIIYLKCECLCEYKHLECAAWVKLHIYNYRFRYLL